MNDLEYMDKTGAIGVWANAWDISMGKRKDKGFHVATKVTVFGTFLVNIIENEPGGLFRLLVVVPPPKFTLCSPETYYLTEWEQVTYYQAKYLAHHFIKKHRVGLIAKFKTSLGYRHLEHIL